MEGFISPAALWHVEQAIALYLDNDRTKGVKPKAVEAELVQLANNIRSYLQHVAADVRKADPDGAAGMAWWNALTPGERVYWMDAAGDTGVAADAWAAFKRSRKAGEPTDEELLA